MDKQLFAQACSRVMDAAEGERRLKGIGTLGEKTLHAVLKYYFEPYEICHEAKIGNYIPDITGENGIIEIQTRNFEKLRKKLDSFLPVARVTVVYPIPRTKWLIWIDKETGDTKGRRKSPKTGKPFEAFFELYKIRQQLRSPNLNICIVMLDVEEYRYLDGWSPDKKKGSTRCDRLPVDIVEEIYIRRPEDYIKLIPEGLAEPFTSRDYGKASGLSTSAAGKALNVLNYVGAVTRVCRRGSMYLYKKRVMTEEENL